jgi:hypothetical protein
MNDDIQTLLDELSGFHMPAANTDEALKSEPILNIEDTEQYFLNKTKAIIDASVGAVQDLTQSTVHGGDAKDVEALSKLVASTAQALDTLNKTNLINKKADRDEQLEVLKLKGKKEIALLRQGPTHVTNNNVLVASREEIMKRLLSEDPSSTGQNYLNK